MTTEVEDLKELMARQRGGRVEPVFNFLAEHRTQLMAGLNHLHCIVLGYGEDGEMAPNTLDRKTRELVGLAVMASQRDWERYPIHVRHVLALGATDEEVIDTLAVAAMLSGSPALRTGTDILMQIRSESTSSHGG